MLGRRIAATWASGSWDVVIRDPSADQRSAALTYVKENIDIYTKATGKTAGKVTATEDLAEAVKDAWQVIEAVPEKLKLKIETFGELDQLTRKDCLL